MIELEKTYLAKYLPEGLTKSPSKELIDIYIPRERVHPLLRLRKNGDKYEITKKVKVSENDASRQIEHTIPLDNEEFSAFSTVDGKKIRKTRYYYPFNGQTAEIDVFQDRLSGLVVVDFEFETPEAQEAFQMPDFCLVDVTQEEFIAGGMLCGKSYQNIKKDLTRLSYQEISPNNNE